MKIIKYVKQSTNKYKLSLEGHESISLYDEIILKYNLLLKKNIKEDELNNILNDNNKLESYYISLRYLNTKQRTTKEIKDYLTNKYYSSNTINEVIERLKKENYLNDDRYIDLFIHDSLLLSLDGPKKIIDKLNKKGVSKEEVISYLDRVPSTTWTDKIETIINKKIKQNHTNSKKEFILKTKNYLLLNGYYKEDIESVFNNIEIEEDKSIIEKEKNKYIRKLKNKYEGNNLIYQVKLKLRIKGFKESDIESLEWDVDDNER